MMNPKPKLHHFLLAASYLLAASSSHAADGIWSVSAGAATHNWTDSGMWASGTIADGTGFNANFTDINITGNKTVSLNGVNRTIGNITFTDATTVSHGLTISGNTLNLDVTTGKPNITVTSTGTAPAGQLTISSQISGNEGLEKNGPGILVLSGNNNHTGTTVINSGTLTLGSANALGAGSSAVSVASGAALNMNGINMGANTNALTLNGSGIDGTGALLNSSTSANGIYTGAISIAGDTTIGNTGTYRMQINSYLATNGHTLSFKGTSAGMIIFSPPASGITGSGSVVVDGAYLRLVDGGGNISTSNYTGTTTVINGGTILYFNNNIGAGNISLNGGTLAGYASAGFTRPFGAGSGQFQITGGESGFGMNGSATINFSNVSEVQWGSASFNPSKFIVGGGSVGFGGTVTFAEGIDLNGANRTILTTDVGILSGVIRTTTGTAGLIKEGGGTLSLTAANTYNGGTTINQGNLRFNSLTAMPSAGNVTVNTGATLTVEAGAAGDWTSGTSGVGTLGGLFSGTGSAGTSTVSFATDSTLGLEMTGNLTYAGDIPNLGTNVGITKTGGSSLTLTGNNIYTGRTRVHAGTLLFNTIANVGAGSSALGAPADATNGTIHIGSGGTGATISYTGSGHSTNRVINLSGSTGGATIDASGTGPLTLTSALTAAAGAKALTLTGSNTAANSLATTALASLTDVLTITKSGAGTWRINSFSSPKNAWTVSAGTLLAAGNITTGDQNFTVSGGTLAGVGPVTLQSTKSLTVGAAGSLSPGISGTGTMAVTGILNISAMAGGTGKLNFEMSAPGSSDRIAVTGTAQIGTGLLGFSDFVFADLGGMTSSTYVLISTTGGFSGTLDPANLSGTIGSIAGTLQINGNNLEFTMDADGDGIPDSWMTQYFNHPTGLESDLSRAGDDPDEDGLTNLQEYQRGTLPKNPDTDADGLTDGVETNTGTWVSASNTGTKPLVLDSDGDTIRDGYETNTGTWVSNTNTGTNPTKADSDTDGLSDGVETNTGTFVSATNTGSHPLVSDTDADGAADWYEIAASFTNPNSASSNPGVPYPLPDPDASTGATDKPVKVYIMSGQSNMVGFGTVNGTDSKALSYITRTLNRFPNLIDSAGNFTARKDVYYRGVISAIGNGPLAPGFSANASTFGPELGFGHIMGWFHDEAVLLLKSSIGNRALGWDILPPGTPSWVYNSSTYPGYGFPIPPTPGTWYAGKQYDYYFKHETEWAHPDTAVTNVVDVLDGWTAEYGGSGKPFAGRDFQIAGFVWWQGDRDRNDMGHATTYERNLVKLINELRSYYTNRYPGKVVPNAPFVLATLGQTAIGDTTPASDVAILNGMLAVDGEAGNYPQFAGNVKTVYAHPLSEGGASNSHYDGRAGTYMMVGDALGRAMMSLESSATGNTYANWMAGYPSVPPTLAGFNQDADGDGVENGAENFFGTNPGIGSAGLVAGAASSNTFTFTHPQNASPATGVTAAYRWSKDLTNFRNHGQTDGDGTTVSFNAVTNAGITTVTATVTGTAASKLFVDVQVIQN